MSYSCWIQMRPTNWIKIFRTFPLYSGKWWERKILCIILPPPSWITVCFFIWNDRTRQSIVFCGINSHACRIILFRDSSSLWANCLTYYFCTPKALQLDSNRKNLEANWGVSEENVSNNSFPIICFYSAPCSSFVTLTS